MTRYIFFSPIRHLLMRPSRDSPSSMNAAPLIFVPMLQLLCRHTRRHNNMRSPRHATSPYAAPAVAPQHMLMPDAAAAKFMPR